VTFTSAVDQATTPVVIYQTERYDGSSGTPNMTYSFPVTSPGSYEARLYMGNGWSGANDPGERVFSVTIEGVAYPDLTDLDLSATFGHEVGGIVVHVVEVTDGLLEIEFSHGSANNPMLNGIEIIAGSGGSPGSIPIVVTPIADQVGQEGQLINLPVLASGGDTPGSLAFGATGLPPGLQIEPTTGLIFGTLGVGASTGSPYNVNVTVDDLDADPTDVQTVPFGWTVNDGSVISWIDKNEDESYTARHECSFVQAGDKFYLFGGRESAQTLDTYDFATNSWTTSASAPIPFNHFQALEHEGLVWVVGAFETNSFPTEDPADSVYVFDPANDVWMQGPDVPIARRRGSAGLVVYDDKLYVVGGNERGHDGLYVDWFDLFDPETGDWTPLTPAPHARDHFHAAVANDKLYVLGGRLSGGAGGTFAPLVPEVDVYDFATSTWSTLPPASDLPNPRAAASVAVFEGKILVIGGEGGGQAYDIVNALDPVANSWETLEPLNFARHGTQAIVSGDGVYVTAGSPNQGGGNQKNMEVYGADVPSGSASVAGVLVAPLAVSVAPGLPESILLEHMGGNVGIFVSSLTLSGPDAADFSITSPPSQPFLLPISGRRDVIVEYVGVAEEADASLDITYSGSQVLNVPLAVPEPDELRALVAGMLCLGSLYRRRQRCLMRA
jgi:N-acetylneuraminic acid mutarotase